VTPAGEMHIRRPKLNDWRATEAKGPQNTRNLCLRSPLAPPYNLKRQFRFEFNNDFASGPNLERSKLPLLLRTG
jgi:hypothetical protein